MAKKVDEVQQMVKSRMNPDGSETLDPRPMSLPVGFERPESIQELIRRLVTDPALREELRASDVESFDDADDFNCDDETFDPRSPYEESFDPSHVITREQEIRSGTVRAPSRADLESAASIIEKHKKPAAEAAAAPPVKGA